MWVTGKDARYFANYDPRMKREAFTTWLLSATTNTCPISTEMVPEFISKMDESLAVIGFTFGEQWK